MKKTTLLSLALSTMLGTAGLHAQAPATPAVPASPAPASEAPKNTKPLSSSDVRALTAITTTMQFHIRMSEVAKSKGRKDIPEAGTFGNAAHKEIVGLWTPLVTMASERKVDNKYITAEVDKRDKELIAKLGKVKEDKWMAEYFELFAKEGKRNAAKLETTVKGISDPDLKSQADAVAKLIAAQTERAATALQELKPKK